MTRRIFHTIALTAVCAVAAAAVLLVITLHASYENRMSDQLCAQAELIARALDMLENDQAYLDGLALQNRVTLIAPDGTVLFDSAADAQTLANHAQRPEVLSAMQSGVGESRRYSDTLAETTIYYARRLLDGGVVRIAGTRESGFGAMLDVLPEMALMLLALMAASLAIARVSARRIVAPLNRLNLDSPLDNDAYDELAPLLTRMDHQHAQIRRQMQELERARAEIDAIMANMREGMVLLDRRNTVLSMNASASDLFEAQRGDGCDLLSLCRDQAVLSVAEAAQAGRSADTLFRKNGRAYRFYASPVEQRGVMRGVVLLILDVTDAYAAEASRREFSANVSHELKTPLTAISGYAEMIRDGISRQEDIPHFAGKIYQEARRMIALINDILQLSRLDEKQSLGAMESVALLPLAQTLAETFLPAARAKDIQLLLTGADVSVQGYPALLREMMQNLVDNAVKYTPAGGQVRLSLTDGPEGVCFAVEDTGIGIPREHQAHVFERFYRVDKSHSRATGGTGLGLAIVKHVADVHHAEVKLESEEGKGTRVSVRFRAQQPLSEALSGPPAGR